MKALLYCTKGKPYLYKTNFVKLEDIKKGCLDKLVYEIDKDERLYLNGDKRENLNGKIVCEVEIDKVEEIVATKWDVGCGCAYYQFKTKDLLRKSCLNYIYLNDYLDRNNGYALHLKNLKVFDRPKELSEYYLLNDNKYILKSIEKAPQNMCRVVDKYRLIFTPNEQYVLISIQPQHLCKILNGENTIEVRRKVLNCLKELKDDE